MKYNESYDCDKVVGTEFPDEGNNGLTESGYPRILKEWKRGTDLQKDSTTIFEVEKTSVSAWYSSDVWAYFGEEYRGKEIGEDREDGTGFKPKKTKRYHWLVDVQTFDTDEQHLKVTVGGENLGAQDLAEATTEYHWPNMGGQVVVLKVTQ
jgi:prolyl oligopeptidase PreP (S9A serine peptidase family)